MSSYHRLDDGSITTADDPKRGIWYSVSGLCGYWTDDWGKLGENNNIPACPVCKCVGMQITAEKWMNIKNDFLIANPRYEEWLQFCKEQCNLWTGLNFMERYILWRDHSE